MLEQNTESTTPYLAAMTALRDSGFTGTQMPGSPASQRAGHRTPRVSVVIPTKNEVRNIPGVLAELPEGLHEVVLVDADSDDGTVETARRIRPDIRVVPQTRRGKGNALVCGFAACTGDVIVMLDADGSADPAEIPAFVEALVGGADFAKGSRFLPGGGSTDLTALRRMGNGVLNFVMNRLYRTAYARDRRRVRDRDPDDRPGRGRPPEGGRGALLRAGPLVRREQPEHLA
jgi:glycosyltransferase involved in cell wall biosynthesis